MRKVILLFVSLLVILGIIVSYTYWPSIERQIRKLTFNKEQESKDLKLTQELLKASKPNEALVIIESYADQINNQTEDGREWLDLLIRATEASNNTQQLVVLYEYYPKAFDAHERAAMQVANYYISNGKSKEYLELREAWKGREAKPEAWFVLDADIFLIEGKRKESIEFLNSKSFPGKADTPRLIRLALLHILEQPQTAWDYLTQASSKDPTNSDIYSYRGKLLETFGNYSEALSDYLKAIQASPENVYLKDQLADYYLRQGNYEYALQIWTQNLAPPSLDIIWLKTLFWSKVTQPISFDWKSINPPEGRLKPLIQYLLSLPQDKFWDAKAYEKIDEGKAFLKSEQVTFWLRLLQAFKDKKDKEAYDLLIYNPFGSISWNPQLESALKYILLYKSSGHFNPEGTAIFLEKQDSIIDQGKNKSDEVDNYFLQLQNFAREEQEGNNTLSKSYETLLKGPDAISSAFLFARWQEAALQLKTQNVFSDQYPSWVAFNFALAIKDVQNPTAALDFAKAQPQTPRMALLTAETLLTLGKTDEAIELLKKRVKDEGKIGFRAAWILSLIYIERAQYQDARKTILAQNGLAEDLTGKETLARIALLEGNIDQANQLYQAIEDQSDEAKSYLARKAFAEKDWKRAKELTEKLLKQYPTNGLLIDNLKKIDEQLQTTKS